VPRAIHRAHKGLARARARSHSLRSFRFFSTTIHYLARPCKRPLDECGMQSVGRASHRKHFGRGRDSRQHRRRFRRLRFAIAEYATALSRAKETLVPLRISVTASLDFHARLDNTKYAKSWNSLSLSPPRGILLPLPLRNISLPHVVSSLLGIEGSEVARLEASMTFH